jgi:hypothetical protein
LTAAVLAPTSLVVVAPVVPEASLPELPVVETPLVELLPLAVVDEDASDDGESSEHAIRRGRMQRHDFAVLDEKALNVGIGV